jgi:cytochrome c-type biogenesis protein CcmE
MNTTVQPSAPNPRPSGLKPRHRRLLLIAAVLLVVAAIVALVINALGGNTNWFYTPSEVAAKKVPVGKAFRVGGLVVEGSVKREGVKVSFVVTDGANQVPVAYQGILPDLFKEGKGVVAQGRMSAGTMAATEVLAKHDENYMPPEAAEAMKRAGHQAPAKP